MIFSENRFPSTDQVSEDKLFGIMRYFTGASRKMRPVLLSVSR